MGAGASVNRSAVAMSAEIGRLRERELNFMVRLYYIMITHPSLNMLT